MEGGLSYQFRDKYFTEELFGGGADVPPRHDVLRLGDQQGEEDVQLADGSLPAALTGGRSAGGARGQLSYQRQHLRFAWEC